MADARAIRILTWNVDGLSETRLGQRMEQLCLEMLIGGDLAAAMANRPTRPMPDVIALQEVVRVGHRGYFRPHLEAAGFTLWPTEPPDDSEYYELLAVGPRWRLEGCERRPFDYSPLGRACTVATVRSRASDARFVALTAHMESLRSGHEPRLDQAREIDAWMREADAPAIFAGDTNLRDAEWNAIAREVSMRDAFVEVGAPAEERVTWRPEGGRGGFRFDRVWLAGGVEAQALTLRRRPTVSDHAGVEVVARLTG